ncbi:MAG: hypothetical protein ACPGED_11800, partial [Flavobacteriales bacterium]
MSSITSNACLEIASAISIELKTQTDLNVEYKSVSCDIPEDSLQITISVNVDVISTEDVDLTELTTVIDDAFEGVSEITSYELDETQSEVDSYKSNKRNKQNDNDTTTTIVVVSVLGV